MLPVSPDCPFLIAPLVCLRSVSCGPNVASVSDCPLVIAPLVCLRSVSCGPNVATVSDFLLLIAPLVFTNVYLIFLKLKLYVN